MPVAKRFWCCTIVAAIVVFSRVAGAGDLQPLFDREWEFRLQEFPMLATYVGRHDYDDRLGRVARVDQQRRAEFWREILRELDAIDRADWTRTDHVNAALFRRQLTDFVTDIEFRDYQIPILVDEGFHTAFARLPSEMPFRTRVDYERYLARLKDWPRYVSEQIANMRAGLARGMTQPKVILDGFDDGIASHVVDDPGDSIFFAPLEEFPVTIADTDRERLASQARAVIEESVVPGYRAFLDFMREEYIPGARRTLGAYALPDGRDYYAFKIRHFTTLDLSADEIHDIGLDEVARIRGEMQAIIDATGFDGSFDDFLTFLRSDPRFYPATPEALLKQAAYIAKTMDGKLPTLFRKLPRTPYTVAPVPDHMAPKYTAGRYVPPAAGSTQPGYYWVNTYDLASRPFYTLTALTLHEAVPGHHLQWALAIEQDTQPDFRQYDYISAYGEGWGLYSEWLGVETGMYQDPYDNFGRLTYEMWRACRLVVDTGLHSRGWTRDQAMDYLADNTALSLHEITTETDRYISWPGQALAYKLGEIKIKELRRRAEEKLAEDFDLRDFHDTLLASGSVTLPLLEQLIDDYIAEALEKR
jgi:uncharacterized protein (DUF885 family)